MNLADAFRFCPRCASREFQKRPDGGFHCPACDLRFYLNTGVAVGAFVVDESGRVLWIRRAREPGKGLWAVPGGFVDAGETAEAAIAREVREETGLELEEPQYLCSAFNPYEFCGHVVPTLDLFFVAQARGELRLAPDEVTHIEYSDPRAMNPDDVAFPSIRAALKRFLETQQCNQQ